MNDTLFRFGVLLDDAAPLFAWLTEHVSGHVVWQMGYKTILGWHVKVVLNSSEAADTFRSQWCQDFWEVQVPKRRAARTSQH